MLAIVAHVGRADLLCGERVLAGVGEAVVLHRVLVLRVKKHTAYGDRINRRRPQNGIAKTNKKPE